MPSPAATISQSTLFARLRWQILRNSLAVIFAGSWLRMATILMCSSIVWGVVYAISTRGFAFLADQNIFLAGGIVGALFDLLFLALMILLIFSSGIILYSSLFSSAESAFLLSLPARADQVFAYKFQAALAFSSWGFLLLGGPVLVAHGLAFGAPWYFFPLLVLFFVGFVLLPGSLGGLACLLIVNFLPRQRKTVLAVVAGLVLLGGVYWILQLQPTGVNDPHYPDFIRRLLGQLSFAQGPLAPNHWMSHGLLAAARGDLEKASYRLALVLGNGLFAYLVTAWCAEKFYRRGFNRISTSGTLRRRYGGTWIDELVDRALQFLDVRTRLLIVKDFRTFRRDPAQWAQVLIFTGLVTLYFTNMRRFYQEDLGRVYQNGVSFINLTATSLLLCSYTGRFIYPMLSLEGNKFWILGLLPLQREALLWGKFAFSAIWSLIISEFLIVFSDLMLGISAIVVIVHAATVVLLAFGLSGLSVGLGAWMPNFRESDPSKIAVGFGGTLNLVAGLLFLVVEIMLMAAPLHLRLAYGDTAQVHVLKDVWLIAGMAAGCLIGAVAIVFPLSIGARVLRQMEF